MAGEKIYDTDGRTELPARRGGRRYKMATISGAPAFVEMNAAENTRRTAEETAFTNRVEPPVLPAAETRAQLDRIRELERRLGIV